MPSMPAPPAELIVFLLAWVVALIVTVAADSVDWPQFLTATTLISGAFIISRGIAKAGKVFENR
jgi:MFS superfamily sulfate permease-like transporter